SRSAPSLAACGMTTSSFNVSAVPALREETREIQSVKDRPIAETKRRHTFASRLAFLTICSFIALTTMAYGTVPYWALALFAPSAAGRGFFLVVCGPGLWSVQV